jgi:hypothetical protein
MAGGSVNVKVMLAVALALLLVCALASADSYCTNCGAKLPAGAKFCPDCGQKAGAVGDTAAGANPVATIAEMISAMQRYGAKSGRPEFIVITGLKTDGIYVDPKSSDAYSLDGDTDSTDGMYILNLRSSTKTLLSTKTPVDASSISCSGGKLRITDAVVIDLSTIDLIEVTAIESAGSTLFVQFNIYTKAATYTRSEVYSLQFPSSPAMTSRSQANSIIQFYNESLTKLLKAFEALAGRPLGVTPATIGNVKM